MQVASTCSHACGDAECHGKPKAAYLEDFGGLGSDLPKGVAEAVEQGAQEEGQVRQHVQIGHAGKHLHPGQQERPLARRCHLERCLELPHKIVHIEVLMRSHNVLCKHSNISLIGIPRD